MNTEQGPHIPVMAQEVVEYAPFVDGPAVYVDCTAGFGGHCAELAKSLRPEDRLIGIDRDLEAVEHCRRRFADAPFQVSFHHASFDRVSEVMDGEGIDQAHFILMDCGFSSPQVDRGERGFSFQKEGPLDMRMDRTQTTTAADIVATWDDRALADIFKNYGDERFGRKIARAIVRRRQEAPIETTQELADIVLQAIPAKYQHSESIHPATRVFQALRIAVNDELEQLRAGLHAGLRRLATGGRFAVLSYHSLEHRIVKDEYRSFCGVGQLTPGPQQLAPERAPDAKVLTRKAVTACAAERNRNPRCRSAQLRVLERL